MIRAFSMALAAILTFGFASVSFADPALNGLAIDGSATAEGTVGTQLTITGSELGTKAPKAALRLHGDPSAKPFALKLAKPFDGNTIHATVSKISPGLYDLVVTPKGVSAANALVLDGAFTARAPQIDSLSATTIAPGDHLDINGRFFGTIRGRVTIADVVAKVLGKWADGKITVLVSKKNRSGTATIDIFGKGGTQDDGATATVVAPITSKDHFTARFNNGVATLSSGDPQMTFATDGIGTFKLDCTKMFGSGVSSNNHLMDINVGAALAPGTYTGAQVFVIYNEVGVQLRNYTSQGAAAWTVTITQRAGNRVSGTISGGLNKTVGNGPASLSVDGDFTLTVK